MILIQYTFLCYYRDLINKIPHVFHKNFPHTRQLESKDCGPACLQMICKYYGSFYELEIFT